MDNVIQSPTSRLTFSDKFLLIPLSMATIILSLVQFLNSGINIYTVFPLFIGAQNLLLLIYRKSEIYRILAARVSMAMFFGIALLFFID